MKKLIILLVTILLLCSCSKEKKPPLYGAVLQNDAGEAVLCFIDEDNKVIHEMKMDRFTPYVYMGEDAVLYSYDGNTYQSITLMDYKKGETIKTEREIIYYVAGGYCYGESGTDIICTKGETNEKISDVYALIGIDGKAYVFFYDGTVSVRDALTNRELIHTEAPLGELIGMVKIEDKVYYVNDSGYTPVDENGFGLTYVYPLKNYEIAGCFKNHLTVYEGNELAAYFVSFDSHRMILTPDYDNESYEGVDFSKRFPSYYEKGYTVMIARAY